VERYLLAISLVRVRDIASQHIRPATTDEHAVANPSVQPPVSFAADSRSMQAGARPDGRVA